LEKRIRKIGWKRLIVVKVGGRLIEQGLPSEISVDIKTVISSNKLILVHGGGIEVTDIASKLGKEQKFITSPAGFRSRYTDKETVQIFTMVMAGKLNKQIVTNLQSIGVNALGLSGLDGQLLKANRKKKLIILDKRGRKRAIDGGYTGKIMSVNTKLLQLMLKEEYTPVVSPIALSEEFEPLNVDGDRVAASISGFLKAETLVLLTDVKGIYLDEKLITKLSVLEAKEILPQIGPGMITKVYAALEALKMGVKEVIITSGRVTTPISLAIEHKHGTVIHYG
jgi:acetylglutamate/LysW-gamma-L-alpha-aminoadipate kinase